MDDQALEQEYDKLASYPETVDYYNLLALPRDPAPTDAQIRSAYRTLTLSFHPDKQPPHLRDAARRQFERIKTAYETLINPKKRVVYDMMGEEGVKAEWSVERTMGKGAIAEQQQVGVQAMDTDQFRRWFLMTMKKRERKVLENMVQNHSLIQLKVDAGSMFHKDFDGSTSIHIPSPKMSSFSVGMNFKTPFSPLEWIRGQKGDHDDSDEDEEVKNNRQAEDGPQYDAEDTQLRIHTSVSGKFQPTRGMVTYVDPETNEEETQEVDLPSQLLARNVSLGATLHHTVDNGMPNGLGLNRLLFPYLGDSELEVGALLLPSPSLTTTISKSIVPVKGASPFQVALETAVAESPIQSPPLFNLSVARRLGIRNQMYCNWSSGELSWPSAIANLLAPLRTNVPENEVQLVMPGQSSKFDLGFIALPMGNVSHNSGAEDEENDEFGNDVIETAAAGSRESWGVLLHTSPMSMQFSINYGRNLFTAGPQRPALSEWNYEGYHPRQGADKNRPVRLEINTTVGIDLSLGWTVTGTRQVSEFSRMGFGVGVQGSRGLVCSITWSRLGQVLKLPVFICPFEFVDADIASLAVIVPWLTYSAIEFGVLRPRKRRRHQKAIEKQRKRLTKLVMRRRTESLQAIDLMGDQVKRRQAKEEEKGGLVILHAEYGYFPEVHLARKSRGDRTETVDVTIPVAALVDQGQLVLPKKIVKSEILGFSDPAPLMPKTLKVKYRFADKDHAVEVQESEGLICPMKSHLLRNSDDPSYGTPAE